MEMAQKHLDATLDAGAVVKVATIPLGTHEVFRPLLECPSVQFVATENGIYVIGWRAFEDGERPKYKILALHNTGRVEEL